MYLIADQYPFYIHELEQEKVRSDKRLVNTPHQCPLPW